jgi:hypothetical protein
VAKVDVPHEPVALECLEIAMHGGYVQVRAARYVLRGYGTICREQGLEHQTPRR